MYARIIHFTLKPEYRNQDFVDQFTLGVPTEVLKIPGFIKSAHLGLRADGKCAVVAFYESSDAANQSRQTLKALWERFHPMMEEEPWVEAYTVFQELSAE